MADDEDESLLSLLRAAAESPHAPGSPTHTLELGAAPMNTLAPRFARLSAQIAGYVTRAEDEPAAADLVSDAAAALRGLDLARIERDLTRLEHAVRRLLGN